MVHRDAAHPAMYSVGGSVGALLEQRITAALAATNFVPAHAGHARRRLHRLVGDHGVVLVEAAECQPERRTLPVRQNVEPADLRHPWFRNASPTWRRGRWTDAGEGGVEARHRKLR